MSRVECPYCEKEVEVSNENGFGLTGDEPYEYECNHCEKIFTFTTVIDVMHYSSKLAVLNEIRLKEEI